MKDWHNYQKRNVGKKSHKLLTYLEKTEVKNIIDLGCGSGNDTVYLLQKGYNVLAIDRQIDEEFFFPRISEDEKARLSFLEEHFEILKLPKCDAIVAIFSLPFCLPSAFDNLWNEIFNSLDSGGYFIGQLFGDEDGWAKKEDITTFSKEDVLTLLKDYNILHFEEVKYQERKGAKVWHYFDIVAQKK